MTHRRSRGNAGFTLVELLIVLVILPLLIGAAAEAVIVTVRNDASTSGRISDSANAQLAGAYFARDVAGALEITADSALAVASGHTFTSAAPEVCAAPSVLSAPGPGAPPGETLEVAVYRRAQPSVNAVDVGYWLEGTGSDVKLVRYSCSLTATYTATNPSSTVLVDSAHNPNAPSLAISPASIALSTSIFPNQIGSAAANGWIATQPGTVSQSTVTLGAGPYSITVPTTVGFTSGWITVQSSGGLQKINCGGITPTSFTSCSGGTGSVSPSDPIIQSSVSAIQATITSPTSSYRYVLVGTPQGAGNQGSGPNPGPGPNPGAPALLTLGPGGVSLGGTGSYTCPFTGATNKVCVNGSVVLDGGIASCNGMAAIGAQTIGAVNPGSTCNPGGIAPSPVILDPVAQHLPASCFTTALASKDNLPTSSATTGTLTPGIYTNPINNATLEPGIYILEGGIAGGGITQTVPSSADPWYQVLNQHTPGSGAGNYDANAGVLMYLPGTASTDQTAGCVEASALPQVSLSPPPSGGITVNPLDSNQSQYWISGNPNLGDMWMWQDKTNTQPLMIQGNIGVTTLAASAPAACNVSGVGNVAGLAYLPGASLVTGNGTESIVTGRLIVGGVQLGGTPNITLSGC